MPVQITDKDLKQIEVDCLNHNGSRITKTMLIDKATYRSPQSITKFKEKYETDELIVSLSSEPFETQFFNDPNMAIVYVRRISVKGLTFITVRINIEGIEENRLLLLQAYVNGRPLSYNKIQAHIMDQEIIHPE